MHDVAWWKRGIVYQVYPRSFQDSNGDGIGDLEGIRRRLDHLAWLGVDAIWISPIFPSPMADFGYDVADYTGIDPLFGTLADIDRLIAEAHGRGLKVLLDFVPNHSSDRHPWFLESRSSRDSPRRDWYVWRDPKPDGSPPNNWISHFGGPSWTYDRATGQYYLHSFLREQPDLDWRNPEVRAAMLDALRFWLERGVDGFRVDVIWLLIKDRLLRDNPPNPDWRPGGPESARLLQLHSADQPEVHEVIAAMRRVLDAYPDRVLIGEIYLPLERLMTYYGRDGEGAHMPFNFALLETPWDARAIDRVVRAYEAALPPGGWPNWVLGNHDRPRIAARVGEAGARVAAMLLLTLRGTPTLYYGDEIGIGRVEIPPDRVQDPWERNEPGRGLGRDPVRTPMPWDGSRNGGFTPAEPWLPLNPDHATRNVAGQAADPASILALHRRLIALRRARPALAIGDYAPIEAEGAVLAYRRGHGSERLAVALNLGDAPARAEIGAGARVLLSTHLDREGEEAGPRVALRPQEGVILEIGA